MRMMQRVARGEPDGVKIDMRLPVTKQVEGHRICASGDAAAGPIAGPVRHLREKTERRINAPKTARVGAMAAA